MRWSGRTMSIGTPRRNSSGKTSAQFPTTPIEVARRSALAATARDTASIKIIGDLVEIAMINSALQPGSVDIDDQADTLVQRHSQRLGPAHPAATASEGQRTGQCHQRFSATAAKVSYVPCTMP